MYIGRLYPAKFSKVDDIFTVTFRDISEFVTYGHTVMDGIMLALDDLYATSEFYLDQGERMPEPSPSEPGEILIPLYIDDEQRAAKLFGESSGF